MVISRIVSFTVELSLFAYDLMKHIHYSPYSTYHITSTKSFDDKDSLLDPVVLAHMWNIALETARRIIQTTTCIICPRNTTTLTLNKFHAAKDRMIRYKHFNCVMFSNTMFVAANVGRSIRIFSCVHIFTTDFG